MDIEIIKNENIVIKIKGRLDTTSSPILNQKIQELEIDKDLLIIDFKELDYIS